MVCQWLIALPGINYFNFTMPVADNKYFTREHIEANRREAPAALAEQAVLCLELVAELAGEGLDFCFKGGNSLLVLLTDPRRFSIDVDIATGESKERISECLEAALSKHRMFTRVTHRQHKTKPWLPMTSYEIYYDSVFPASGESFIMLDAMLKKSGYPLVKRKVACGDLYASAAEAFLPAVESLLADKLLTLGPGTLGIPLGRKKEAQRLKHGHDISLLMTKRPDLDLLRRALCLCLDAENGLQEKKCTLAEVLKDTLAFCASPLDYAAEPSLEGLSGGMREIVYGRRPFEEHLFKRDYPWARLQLDLARAALCLYAAWDNNVDNDGFHPALDFTDAALIWKRIALWHGRDPFTHDLTSPLE